ncbi:MAG: phosphohistidine phosphatase SixA [Gammaproteobacteria bacterium]|jgi:phosphohistidine phosphatase SixA
MKSTIKNILVISLFFLYTSNVNAEAKFSDIQTPSVLIEALKAGGYIIYMRHGLTKKKENLDTLFPLRSRVDLSRCETQRNLSEAGKSQIQQLGMAIRLSNIPIGKVKSSPYCRTKDSAQAVFGEFEVDEKLKFSITMHSKEAKLVGQYLLDSMLASNDVRANTVYVGHTANLKDGLGVWPKPEGAMAIFKKQGNKIIFKGMISPDDWPKL